jgi:ribose 5-phosphate isomerase A
VGAEDEKRVAAEAAAELVEDGMRVGLGTGSTVGHLLPALAARGRAIRCVATSPATEAAARRLGLALDDFAERDSFPRLEIAIDGADQVAPDGWLIKGGGGALTREKIVAAAAERFVVIADSTKPVERLAAPVPLELHRFGVEATISILGAAELRDAPPSPDGGLIADYRGELEDPEELAAWLATVPGVVEHGLFPPALVSDVIVGRGDVAEHQRLAGPDSRGGD